MKKRLSLFLTFLAGLSLAAHASTPPLRGDVGRDALDPFILSQYQSTGDGAGSAQAMFNALDASCRLREGLSKSYLKDQLVYYEPYSFHASLLVQRPDGSTMQDFWNAGESRLTGTSYITREWLDNKTFREETTYHDEGFVWIVGALLSHIKDEEISVGTAGIQIWYTPLQVHIKGVETVSPVFEGGVGAMEMLLTDIKDRWGIDGYTFKRTSMNPEIFTLENDQVTTDGEGKALIRLRGVKAGKARLRIYLYLAQPENNCYVQVEEYLDVEVLEPEKWSYDISVHDAFTMPAQDYSLRGRFEVISTLGEDNMPRYKMLNVSKADKSDGGSFDAHGDFVTETDKGDGFALGFDLGGMLVRAKETQNTIVPRMMGEIPTQILQFLAGGEAPTTDSPNPITMIMALLEEGSWSYKTDRETLGIVEGVSRSEPAVQVEEEAPAKGKKEKKKGALRELRDAFKALNDLSDQLAQSAASRPSAAEAVEASRKRQIAYVREHHCLVVPDLTQMMHSQLGNMIQEAQKYEQSGMSWQEVHGTLTLHREDH